MAQWFYLSTDIDPYPKVNIPHTYPEKGHYFHHVPYLPYIAHNLHTKFHDKDLDVHVPKTDVRETLRAFYIEVELPGVKDHQDLRLRWSTEKTLLLTSKTTRPEIVEEGEAELVATEEEVTAPTAANGQEAATATVTTEAEPQEPTALPTVPAAEEAPTAVAAVVPHLTIHERLIGEMVRGFTFPVEVNRDLTHAKLDAGILNIVVPKVVHDHIHTIIPKTEEQKEKEKEKEKEKGFLHVPIHILHHTNGQVKRTKEQKETEPEPETPQQPST